MIERFPWYDSRWLYCYLNAKRFIAETCPDKLEHFEESLRPFRTGKEFRVRQVPQALSTNQLQQARERAHRHHPLDLELHEVKSHGRFVLHNDPFFNVLHVELTGLVSDLVGEEVEPSYNFLSMYHGHGVCDVHLDGPNAKWTLDICLEQSTTWPIYISEVQEWPDEHFVVDESWKATIKEQVSFEEYVMTPDDGLIFSGSSQWHYREPIPRTEKKSFAHLVFFHFVPKGSKELSKPANWPKLFGLPGLTEACPDLRG